MEREDKRVAQLWGGRFTKETDKLVYNFNASISFDQKFYKQDMEGSIAHVKMLGKQGILTEKEMQDKGIWLAKNYPMISEHLFLSRDKSKTTAILKYCNEHNINLKDVIFVDDIIPILIEAEREGSRSFHISSFLDWEYSML